MTSRLPRHDLELREGSERSWLGWQSALSPLFEVQTDAPERFAARSSSYNLGPLVVGPVRTVPQRYQRSLRRIAVSGLDHILVQVTRVGQSAGDAAGKAMVAGAGDACVLDLSRPLEAEDDVSDAFNIVVPQALLEEVIGRSTDLHGLVIRGESVTGGLLREFVDALDERLPHATLTDAPELVESTLTLLGSAVRSETRLLEGAQVHVEALTAIRVRRYIRRNLRSPDLGPRRLCEQFGLSRTQLYRQFEREGGVATYIRTLRLQRCLLAIADPSHGRQSLEEIAEEHGLCCGAHFSRLFRKTFGVSPSQVRRGRLALNGSSYSEWLRALG